MTEEIIIDELDRYRLPRLAEYKGYAIDTSKIAKGGNRKEKKI